MELGTTSLPDSDMEDCTGVEIGTNKWTKKSARRVEKPSLWAAFIEGKMAAHSQTAKSV
jgi:hypothetical protein